MECVVKSASDSVAAKVFGPIRIEHSQEKASIQFKPNNQKPVAADTKMAVTDLRCQLGKGISLIGYCIAVNQDEVVPD